jgi:hypothetical protein
MKAERTNGAIGSSGANASTVSHVQSAEHVGAKASSGAVGVGSSASVGSIPVPFDPPQRSSRRAAALATVPERRASMPSTLLELMSSADVQGMKEADVRGVKSANGHIITRRVTAVPACSTSQNGLGAAQRLAR